MTKPSDTIESREPRYGDYYERSELKERIVEAFSEGRNWMDLEPDARNSLMMIADKLSRILNGDADDPDGWHDIGGYAELVEKRLNDNGLKQLGDKSVGYKIALTVRMNDEGDWRAIFSTRCPYFTGTPPSWDDAPEWADWLAQNESGQFNWARGNVTAKDYEDLTNLIGTGFWSGGMQAVAGFGHDNPNWKNAIEPRPETHK